MGGEKGGVGKSVCARALAQWCVDRKLPFAAIDCDVTQQSLARSYGEFTQVVDLGHTESADQIVDRALGAERRVVVDLPAQGARLLQRWLDGARVLEYAQELGVHVTFFHVTDGGAASVRELERSIEHIGNRAGHVLVKNLGRAHDFVQLDESSARQRLRELGSQEMALPALEATAMYKVDRYGMSFWAASQTHEGEQTLGPLERRRVQLWLEQCYCEFDRVLP